MAVSAWEPQPLGMVSHFDRMKYRGSVLGGAVARSAVSKVECGHDDAVRTSDLGDCAVCRDIGCQANSQSHVLGEVHDGRYLKTDEAMYYEKQD